MKRFLGHIFSCAIMCAIGCRSQSIGHAEHNAKPSTRLKVVFADGEPASYARLALFEDGQAVLREGKDPRLYDFSLNMLCADGAGEISVGAELRKGAECYIYNEIGKDFPESGPWTAEDYRDHWPTLHIDIEAPRQWRIRLPRETQSFRLLLNAINPVDYVAITTSPNYKEAGSGVEFDYDTRVPIFIRCCDFKPNTPYRIPMPEAPKSNGVSTWEEVFVYPAAWRGGRRVSGHRQFIPRTDDELFVIEEEEK